MKRHPLGRDRCGNGLMRGGVLQPLTGALAQTGLHRMRSVADVDDPGGAERVRRSLGMDGEGDERAGCGGRNRLADRVRPTLS